MNISKRAPNLNWATFTQNEPHERLSNTNPKLFFNFNKIHEYNLIYKKSSLLKNLFFLEWENFGEDFDFKRLDPSYGSIKVPRRVSFE